MKEILKSNTSVYDLASSSSKLRISECRFFQIAHPHNLSSS